MSPRSLVFWRHAVGVAIVLLAQHPRLYDNSMMFLGLWVGTSVIAFGGAAIATGLGYLFATNALRGKAWGTFVVLAWLLAGFQLIGEWVLPSMIQQIATGAPKTSLTAASTSACQSMTTPSLDEFLEKARPKNPGHSDAALTDYWALTYSRDRVAEIRKCGGKPSFWEEYEAERASGLALSAQGQQSPASAAPVQK